GRRTRIAVGALDAEEVVGLLGQAALAPAGLQDRLGRGHRGGYPEAFVPGLGGVADRFDEPVPRAGLGRVRRARGGLTGLLVRVAGAAGGGLTVAGAAVGYLG